MPRSVRLGPLGWRLAAAFLTVALIALAAFAVLTVLAERHDVSSLAGAQRTEATGAIVSAAENAYRANGGWSGSDLQPVVVLASLTSGATELSTPNGAVLMRTGAEGLLGTSGALQVTRPLFADGELVGRVHLAFPVGGLTGPEQRLRTDLAEAAGLAALIAALVALVASLGLSRVVVRPLRRLSFAAHAIGGGDRDVRIGPRAGPGELAELGKAFDSMVVALDRAERARQALVAEVAHELRTPVAVLQAETEALVDGVRRATPGALASLHEEAIRLGQRIEDLQTLASADAAGLSLEPTAVDLDEVAARAADLLAGRFDAAGVRLERSFVPTPVWADAQRLNQVVTNLLVNACKFAPAGGSVRLDVHPAHGGGEVVIVDNGPGIPPDEQAHVFDRFYRGSARKQAAGSGIGLAVVDRIVHAHGGDVRVDSPPGGGARFVVHLPGAGDHRAPVPAATPTRSPGPDLG